MVLAKRIIPALDIKDGQVVKGVQFKDVKAVGDPVALAKRYQVTGADELVLLDISATLENRGTIYDVVSAVSAAVFIPLTVGGGIRTVDNMTQLIASGADKVFVNSAAIDNPNLVRAGAEKFGRQAIAGAIDVKWDVAWQKYRVYKAGGTIPTNLEAITWAQELVRLGAGELLVTSMDADGGQQGFDVALYQQLLANVRVPVIASGGAGQIADFTEVFLETQVDAVLAASVFHFDKIPIPVLKTQLTKEGVTVRNA
ncbi:imidazole glycerol phosphate synthase subunit HisF [Weissella confusa]|uniref:imidazole glycerol phosphate synthase subunit HisF n=1 Tax=Weissella confusa TaxID=1583 RepID=UPI00396F2FCC